MKRNAHCLVMLLTIAVIAGSPPMALAQKDKKPGGGGGGGGYETPTGTIYYHHGEIADIVQMHATGMEKLPLHVGSGLLSPSHATYNGNRYFLKEPAIYTTLLAVPDDGTPAVELLQPGEDGDWVAVAGRVEWVNDGPLLDARVSWFARNLTTGEQAVRRAPVLRDVNGNVCGLNLGLIDSYDEITNDYHWSPDGGKIVYAMKGWLFIYDSQMNEHQPLFVDQAANPVWSPDGLRVAYRYLDGVDTSVATVTLATGARTTIVRGRSGMQAYSPQWSPTGSHLTYVRTTHKGFDRSYHIWRCRSDGSDHVDLTPEYKNNIWGAYPLGWR